MPAKRLTQTVGHTRLSATTVHRIWGAFGLQPHPRRPRRRAHPRFALFLRLCRRVGRPRASDDRQTPRPHTGANNGALCPSRRRSREIGRECRCRISSGCTGELTRAQTRRDSEVLGAEKSTRREKSSHFWPFLGVWISAALSHPSRWTRDKSSELTSGMPPALVAISRSLKFVLSAMSRHVTHLTLLDWLSPNY